MSYICRYDLWNKLDDQNTETCQHTIHINISNYSSMNREHILVSWETPNGQRGMGHQVCIYAASARNAARHALSG